MDTATRYTWKFRFVLLALAVAWGSFNKVGDTPSKAAKARVERTLTAEGRASEAGKPAIRKVSDVAPRRTAAPKAWPVSTFQSDPSSAPNGLRATNAALPESRR
jgi:hypothetical protein